MLTINELKNRQAQIGRLEWIGLRPGRQEPIVSVSSAFVEEKGLAGDRTSRANDRSVTLIQAEHLPVIASLCGKENLTPEIFRRNLMVSRINLLTLRGKQFRIGKVVLEGTDHCAPCSKMERALGHGGYNAMRGHGGITAKVIKTGNIQIGDEIELHHAYL